VVASRYEELNVPDDRALDPQWRVLHSAIAHQSWVTVVRDRLQKPSGDEMDYTYVATKDAAAMLAFTATNQAVLTRQYRHPLRRVVFDLPAGGVHDHEQPEQAAVRELAEETGFIAQNLRLLGRFYPAPGLMSHTVHVFTAHVDEQRPQALDEHEMIDIVRLDWSELLQLVSSEEAVDATLAYAVLRYAAHTTGR
jgi:ADP-ribose pyrophosphatase